jgi:predicted TIM-barrel fold metal-dependent hydrolase
MREDHPVRKAMEISERTRVDVYAGTSAFPLTQYNRRDAEGTLMTEGSLGAGDGPSDEDDEEVLIPSQYGDIGESIGGDEVASLFENIGVAAVVVNPTLYAGIAEVQNDRFAVEMARAYNEWLLDNVADQDSIVGNMVVAPQVPHKVAEEIDARADADNIVGIQLSAAGLHPGPGHR